MIHGLFKWVMWGWRVGLVGEGRKSADWASAPAPVVTGEISRVCVCMYIHVC